MLTEADRLSALRNLGAIEAPRDAGIDSVVRHLAAVWDVPIAAVTLIDEHRQWFKSSFGLNITQTPRSMSFCAGLLDQDDSLLIVEDACLDPRFAHNPLVSGDPRIRFYAGEAIRDGSGHVLGALCVIDHRPRKPKLRHLSALKTLAETVSSLLILQHSNIALQRAAMTDPLTGPYNRKGLDKFISLLPLNISCFLLLDLDHFKRINDSFGHAAGDLALTEVAKRLSNLIGPKDAVARIGGDEFAILLAEVGDAHSGLRFAESVHRALSDPFLFGRTPMNVKASIGIACRPLHGVDTTALFDRADAALYAAKAAGRGTTRVTPHDEDSIIKRIGRTTLGERLADAMASPENAFRLVYQPIFDTVSGEVRSVEALVRWQLDDVEVSPSIFVPLAESLGLAPEIDDFVLRIARQAASAWPATRRLSVNFSALSFGLKTLERKLLETNTQAVPGDRRLTVELTETAFAAMPDELCRVLERLVEGGLSVAIDDFGAGQTSLLQLRRLPIRTLKIDRSLVHDAALDERAKKILISIVSLGAALGITVVAEGIETAADFRLSRTIGVPRAQGFFLSPPVAIELLEQSIIEGTVKIAGFL